MKISLIVATAQNGVIGIHNQLPWHLPEDLRHFKTLTLGKPIIMGRHTYESIGKPLPGRRNIVVSRNPDLNIPGCEVAPSIDAALSLVHDQPEVMIIGGTQIFREVAPRVDQVYLTIVWQVFTGDSSLPAIYHNAMVWRILDCQHHRSTAEQPLAYSFLALQPRMGKLRTWVHACTRFLPHTSIIHHCKPHE
ncbi:MAG: dihydrofolate reductase [Gammaproteobacteria bacterium]